METADKPRAPESWTVDRVLHAMDLRPWKERYIEGIASTLGRRAELGIEGTYEAIQQGRGTGATTKMLAEAAAYILDRQQRPGSAHIGPAALIYAAPEHFAEELRQRLRKVVALLGGDPTSVVEPRLYIYFGEGKGKNFIDRTCDAEDTRVSTDTTLCPT